MTNEASTAIINTKYFAPVKDFAQVSFVLNDFQHGHNTKKSTAEN